MREAGSGKREQLLEREPSPPRLVRFPLPASRIPAALVLAALLYLGFRPLGALPPLGALLDPANGVWAVASTAELPRSAAGRVPGLRADVRVLYDRRAVPHIFAANELDAYRALGYVVARDRLFQLELQARAGAGTLTELLGSRAIEMDREMRAIGLPSAAERKLAGLDTASIGYHVMRAYADGVNAWIDAMRPSDLPIEYRLLGAHPMRWKPIDSIHLLDRMGYTLAFEPEELRHLRYQALVGKAAADALLPIDSPIQQPIQPAHRAEPRDAFAPLPPPGAPDLHALEDVRVIDEVGALLADDDQRWRGDVLGSDNWAVAPRRTRDGFALLAGDPHLELTLPSIWYEVHLVVPDTLDVYGVTIPGAPGVILGFNRDVAWSFTNTGADVLDLYRETVDDSLHPTRHLVDGAWRPVERRIEQYRGPRGAVLAVDTMYATERGPMRRVGGDWLSMRWTVLDLSSEIDGFVRAAHATTARAWLDAMAGYVAPAQNMIVADHAGTIAIRSTGRFPLRAGNGRGDVVHDGSLGTSDWVGTWPVSRYPFAMNPAQGYLASANQQPIDPAVDSSYLGADWPPPWRAMRINALLRADSSVTPDDMRRFQTDPGSARADRFVPYFLAAARAREAHDSTLHEAATLLAQWDRRYTKDNQRAILFELAMDELQHRVWDELIAPNDAASFRPPSESVLTELLAYPDNVWWDDRRTRAVEHRDDILASSLDAALQRAVGEYGDPDAGGWRWDRIQHANIYHVLHLPSFSALGLPVQGGPSTLNPSSGSGTFGPSWRMVVEMGPQVHGWSIYPGGQSGNPVSSRYLDRLPQWLAGKLDPALFPYRASELDSARVVSTLTLAPSR